MAVLQKENENREDENEDDACADEDDIVIEDETKKSGNDTTVKEKRKRKNKPRNKQNKCWIYITGLPPDVTTEELKSHFSKVLIFNRSQLINQPTNQPINQPINKPTNQSFNHFNLPCFLFFPIFVGGLDSNKSI